MKARIMGVLVCGLLSIGSGPGPQGVIGAWHYADARKGALVLTFQSDYSYQVDFNGDGITDIHGVYEFWDDRLILGDEVPAQVTDCVALGVYLYQVDRERLTFQLYSDDCQPRRAVLGESFVRQAISRF
ncbi:MAG: hypothetical protein K8I00_09050 [Candidatus Omnitrophica bacterium]|nr:hypothetical protein [Candidatus Omnitrophota bacterium]